MPKSWSHLAEASGIYLDQDFQSAAYQLLCAQVLYESEQSQRVAYRLLSSYRSEFREAFRLFGMDIQFVDEYRYCAAIPEAGRKVVLTLVESQLVLVLRKLYHELVSRGAVEEGTATVTIDELRAAFTAATRRELPTQIKELEALIERMHRFGIAKAVSAETDELQPFDVAILPGIQTLVNEAALMKLSQHYESAAALASVRGAVKDPGHRAQAEEVLSDSP